MSFDILLPAPGSSPHVSFANTIGSSETMARSRTASLAIVVARVVAGGEEVLVEFVVPQILVDVDVLDVLEVAVQPRFGTSIVVALKGCCLLHSRCAGQCGLEESTRCCASVCVFDLGQAILDLDE